MPTRRKGYDFSVKGCMRTAKVAARCAPSTLYRCLAVLRADGSPKARDAIALIEAKIKA